MMMLLTLVIWNPPPRIAASGPTPRIVLFDFTRTGLARWIVPETRMIKGGLLSAWATSDAASETVTIAPPWPPVVPPSTEAQPIGTSSPGRRQPSRAGARMTPSPPAWECLLLHRGDPLE